MQAQATPATFWNNDLCQRHLACEKRCQKTDKGSWVALTSLLSTIEQKANSVVVIPSLKQIPSYVVFFNATSRQTLIEPRVPGSGARFAELRVDGQGIWDAT
jgi:hypothetical protein